MVIDEKQLQHWMDHFYGYGSWDASIWFIDYEEGGGELPEEVAEKLHYFHNSHPSVTTPTLCDIRDLYRHVSFRENGPRADVFNTLYEYRFDGNARLHGVWKNLIAFVYGYKREPVPDLLAYQKSLFASPSMRNEAWIKLYPLPSPHNHAWYYAWLVIPGFAFIRSRTSYQEHLYQRRIHAILSNVHTHQPKVVVMYGMENINLLKHSVQEFFPRAKFKIVKAVKQHIPQHHISDVDGTSLVITTQIPALRHNRKETGFDWEEFGRMVSQ